MEAGQEGHHVHLGKARDPEEHCHVISPPEPIQVPPLPTLPLAGLVKLAGMVSDYKTDKPLAVYI